MVSILGIIDRLIGPFVVTGIGVALLFVPGVEQDVALAVLWLGIGTVIDLSPSTLVGKIRPRSAEEDEEGFREAARRRFREEAGTVREMVDVDDLGLRRG